MGGGRLVVSVWHREDPLPITPPLGLGEGAEGSERAAVTAWFVLQRRLYFLWEASYEQPQGCGGKKGSGPFVYIKKKKSCSNDLWTLTLLNTHSPQSSNPQSQPPALSHLLILCCHDNTDLSPPCPGSCICYQLNGQEDFLLLPHSYASQRWQTSNKISTDCSRTWYRFLFLRPLQPRSTAGAAK